MTNVINGHITSFMQYLHLREVNTSLAEENAKLKNQLDWFLSRDTLVRSERLDTTKGMRYSYTMAQVVNNSTSKQHNYITLNRGAAQGVRPEMGVVTSDGIVGVVLSTSRNYSLVLSMLNLNFKVSARLKRTGYFGSLSWDGKDARYMNLSDIPQQAKIKVGDSVETSNYSTIFPEGIYIGSVESYKVQGGNFYQLRVRLQNDFKRLRYVHLITDFKKAEKQKLESTVANEE
jgi:rod shape-determining protein MreC